jgi:hypothetical protein
MIIGTGILSMVAGVIALSYESEQKRQKEYFKNIRYRYLFYPITASIFYGLSVFLRKTRAQYRELHHSWSHPHLGTS